MVQIIEKIEAMKEFINNLKNMYYHRKYRDHPQIESYYQWYKYLVEYDLKRLISRFKFWRNKSELPF